MSLYGMMKTGVSGMNAQANRLSTVADNISNSSTNGYKRADTEFSTLVVPGTSGSYNSGGVTTNVRHSISDQGVLDYTTSITDLAIQGEGFFVVQDGGGQPYLSRAGSFVVNNDGSLVNAGGYQLMGYSYENGVPTPTANGYAGLEPITIKETELTATPSKNGSISGNLPLDAEIVTGDTPNNNLATSTYTKKTSVVAYGDRGEEIMLDVFFTKTGSDTWEMTVFNSADANAGSDTGFEYSSAALGTVPALTFDAKGKLQSPDPAEIAIDNPSGTENITIDLSSMTQLAAEYDVEAKVDGSEPSAVDTLHISEDGVVSAQYEDGSLRPLYRIPLANVPSPDQLQVLSGNVFAQSADSGDVSIGFPAEGGGGKVVSGALENSNVDIAQELTSMIESQRSYTANSKVFQTGSDLLELLVNLKR